jgi:amino-acid N-acetyltransferase
MILDLAMPKDELWIRQLLALCGLPHEDITPQHLRHFFVTKQNGDILGVIGLEIFGRLALLRSLGVDPRFRKRGLAAQLMKKAEEYAASLEIEELYLLTMTAESFFLKRGYQRIERNSGPPAIRGTAEFQGLCPVSSMLMIKQLKGNKI